MCEKINCDKIEQGFINLMSDLVIMKACKAMNSWNDNYLAGNDNEPCELVTNGRTENAVTMAWQPMRDRKNRLGQCMGTEVKNFVKDVMETRSCGYGFILYWAKCRYFGFKEATVWISVLCVMGAFYL